VDAIARLARLALSDEEAERLRGELGAILDHMRDLAALDTAGVEPMTHAVPMALRLRPDEVEPSLPVGDAVGPAPDRAGDFFQVPKIIEG
jgi:aspartyl-tRNA(Asn)/glutamyl-tRNA(Gln) amidotransferase subunit C